MPRTSIEFERLAAVVFSKDRPLQLDATLASLFRHCSDPDRMRVEVLYTTSSAHGEGLYRRLRLEYPGVAFLRERRFRQDLLTLVARTRFVAFIVDDALFVRGFSVEAITEELGPDDPAIGFSLRLGTNTTYCYPLDAAQNLPDFTSRRPGILAYRWPDASHDFGYPLELSSSVYRTADIEPLLRRLKFGNPNTLEAAMAATASTFAAKRPMLLCFERSAAFCIPANMVQSAIPNRAAANPDETPDALATAFERGDRIDVARYDDFPNNAAHQEVPLWIGQPDRRGLAAARPMFSILIAAHDAQDTIGATLDSVMAQTRADWEAFVTDDGSTDDTGAIAARYAERDERIHVIRQENRGAGAARNAAAAQAHGDLLCILDADDQYRPDYLESQAAFIDLHPGFDIYSCNADALQASGAIAPLDPARYPRRVVSWRLAEMIRANRIFVASVVRADSFRAVGGFREGVSVEDYDLWLRLLARGGSHIHNPASLVLYRITAGGKTSRPIQALRSMIEAYEHLAASEPSGATEAAGARLQVAIRRQISATQRQIARLEALDDWRDLKARLAALDYSGARRRYWAVRGAHINRARYLAGLGLVAVSPRLLAAAVRHGRPRPESVEPS